MEQVITVRGAALVVEVRAEIHGTYIPASYYQPEEHPEVEVLSVTVIEDEDGTGQFEVGQDVLDLIDNDTYDEIAREFEEDAKGRAAADEEDYWDGVRKDQAMGLL